MSDLSIVANGLFPDGFDVGLLTPAGKAEVRAAINAILRVWDERARLELALRQIDRAADEIDRLRAVIRDAAEAIERQSTTAPVLESLRAALNQ